MCESGFFFFQAKDGIRVIGVTGVQTCAFPIYATPPPLKRFVVKPGTASDTHSSVAVSSEPATAFRLLVDGKPVQQGTTTDGNIAQSLDLADGRHSVVIELRDEVGNLRTETRPLLVRIPELEVTADLTAGATDKVQVIRMDAEAAATGV